MYIHVFCANCTTILPGSVLSQLTNPTDPRKAMIEMRHASIGTPHIRGASGGVVATSMLATTVTPLNTKLMTRNAHG